jgi:gamma-glutamyl:cysteine ligase YbdK (ATP-grasp superfamily)
MSTKRSALHAFDAYGIELEYMIVADADLNVLPAADALLRGYAGDDSGEADRGLFGWSNELVLHVIEIKNQRPFADLAAMALAFQDEVGAINNRLQIMDARLMPTAMHPWMDPATQTRLWPHHNDAIYQAYARLFDTKSHGWANLQSMHVNLPFADDAEFARLHAAIRLLLPILPALAASSPIADGRITGDADYRMQVYWHNADRMPAIAGQVVPEPVASRADYEDIILQPMYRDIAPHDPEGILRHEWLNSRGAIARFDRNAIEIRVLDVQECPQADLAIAAAVIHAVQDLYRMDAAKAQDAMPTAELAQILRDCIRDGERAVIDHAAYLDLLGYPGSQCDAAALWAHLIARMPQAEGEAFWRKPLSTMLDHGTLSRRILRALGDAPARMRMEQVYRELCECLAQGSMFLPHG